jgi:hypothetical protein
MPTLFLQAPEYLGCQLSIVRPELYFAKRYDNVRILFGRDLVDFTQDDTGVTV